MHDLRGCYLLDIFRGLVRPWQLIVPTLVPFGGGGIHFILVISGVVVSCMCVCICVMCVMCMLCKYAGGLVGR